MLREKAVNVYFEKINLHKKKRSLPKIWNENLKMQALKKLIFKRKTWLSNIKHFCIAFVKGAFGDY